MLGIGTTIANAQTTAKQETKTKTAVHTKADGTPDKRYKENKSTTTVTGPTKKDGTPDMRYKANKTSSQQTTVKKTKKNP